MKTKLQTVTFDALAWCVAWFIFWTGLWRELRASEAMDAYAGAIPATMPDDDDDDDEETEMLPAAAFTDEDMAPTLEDWRAVGQDIALAMGAMPAPAARERICRFCWYVQGETAESTPLKPLYDVEWIVCEHHKRARQQVRDEAVLTSVFPTLPYVCSLPGRHELN